MCERSSLYVHTYHSVSTLFTKLKEDGKEGRGGGEGGKEGESELLLLFSTFAFVVMV